MTFIGHLALALVPAAVAASMTGNLINLQVPLLLGAVALGALLPDVDEPGSYIGRKLMFIAVILKGIGIKHRTLTHWLALPLAMAVASILAFGVHGALIFLALSYGMVMHSVGDMLTKGGIKGFFWPFFPHTTIRILPRSVAFYTGSLQEYILIFLLLAAGFMGVVYGAH